MRAAEAEAAVEAGFGGRRYSRKSKEAAESRKTVLLPPPPLLLVHTPLQPTTAENGSQRTKVSVGRAAAARRGR